MFVGNCFVIMAVCSWQFTDAAVTKDIDDTKIIFPGPTQEILTNRFGTENKTDPCKGRTYCTIKPPDYPQDLFNNMFKEKIKEPIFRPAPVMLDDRQGDPDEKEDCESDVSFEPIYQVRSKKGKMLTVVQAPEGNFLQSIRIETCINSGAKCFQDFQAPPDLEPYCAETYNDWEFLVYDENKKTVKETVSLPVCCSCHFKRI